jgi:hypothetical protein
MEVEIPVTKGRERGYCKVGKRGELERVAREDWVVEGKIRTETKRRHREENFMAHENYFEIKFVSVKKEGSMRSSYVSFEGSFFEVVKKLKGLFKFPLIRILELTISGYN